jgi:hypothetical protein
MVNLLTSKATQLTGHLDPFKLQIVRATQALGASMGDGRTQYAGGHGLLVQASSFLYAFFIGW